MGIKKTTHKGISVIELLIIIVIIGILTAITAATYIGIQNQARLNVARVDMASFAEATDLYWIRTRTQPTTAAQFSEIIRDAGLYDSTRTEEKSYAICADDNGFAVVAWNPIVDGYKNQDTLYMYSSGYGQVTYSLTNSSLSSANLLDKICTQVHPDATFDVWTYDLP